MSSGCRHVTGYFLFLAMASWLLTGCGQTDETALPKPVQFDLAQIREEGTLTALCRYSSTSYFIYKGEPMGYEYELLKLLADHLGLDLEIKVPKRWDDLFHMLNRGEGDIIAANMKVTLEQAEKAAFTRHHSTTRQMLVQRKPKRWRRMKIHQIEKKLVRDPIRLIGKKVYVRQSSAYYSRLKNLSEEVGGQIDIVEIPEEMETELLIKMVSDGVIDFTVAEENLVRGFGTYYPNLDMKTPISFPQRVAWAVRKNSPELLESLNSWITKMKKSKEPVYYVIYNKYFKNRKAFIKRMSSNYLSVTGGKISPYDSLFKAYSDEIGWDWKLVASLAFQESQFNPKAVSWVGAVGIMQILPHTARELGIKNPENPEQSIQAGTKLLKLLHAYWESIPDKQERIKFTLAAYNAGQGHIEDARRLAKKYGKDANVWTDNVAEFIVKKSEKKYYFDEVVKYGYCRGEEPVKFVKQVLERYEIYRSYEDYLDQETVSRVKAAIGKRVGRL